MLLPAAHERGVEVDRLVLGPARGQGRSVLAAHLGEGVQGKEAGVQEAEEERVQENEAGVQGEEEGFQGEEAGKG